MPARPRTVCSPALGGMSRTWCSPPAEARRSSRGTPPEASSAFSCGRAFRTCASTTAPIVRDPSTHPERLTARGDGDARPLSDRADDEHLQPRHPGHAARCCGAAGCPPASAKLMDFGGQFGGQRRTCSWPWIRCSAWLTLRGVWDLAPAQELAARAVEAEFEVGRAAGPICHHLAFLTRQH